MAVKTGHVITVNLTVSGNVELTDIAANSLRDALLVDLEDRVVALVDRHLEVAPEDSVEVEVEWEPAPRINRLPDGARVKEVTATLNDLLDALTYAGLMAGDGSGDPAGAAVAGDGGGSLPGADKAA